jgi:hypothetical protein
MERMRMQAKLAQSGMGQQFPANVQPQPPHFQAPQSDAQSQSQALLHHMPRAPSQPQQPPQPAPQPQQQVQPTQQQQRMQQLLWLAPMTVQDLVEKAKMTPEQARRFYEQERPKILEMLRASHAQQAQQAQQSNIQNAPVFPISAAASSQQQQAGPSAPPANGNPQNISRPATAQPPTQPSTSFSSGPSLAPDRLASSALKIQQLKQMFLQERTNI